MDLKERISVPDWVAGIASLILLISVFLEWYHVGAFGFRAGGSGWDATKLAILVFLMALASIAIVALRIAQFDLSMIPIPIGVILLGLGGLSALIVLIRIIIRPGGGGITLSVSYGIFIALLAAIAVAVGGAMMIREES